MKTLIKNKDFFWKILFQTKILFSAGYQIFWHINVVFPTFFHEKSEQFNCSPLQTLKMNLWEGTNPWEKGIIIAHFKELLLY